jgi:hypothetical protein
MRDRRDIEREMFTAREDLEQSVNELKHAIAEKVNVKARATHAVDERVDRVKDAARHGLERGRELMYRTRDGAVIYYHRARDSARQHKLLLGLILGGVTLLTVGTVLLVRHRRHRRFI